MTDKVYDQRETRHALLKAQADEARRKVDQHVDSANDDRTVNNAVRHQYRVLSDAEKAQMQDIKDLGATFLMKCDHIGGSREMALAKTKIEEAVMWAVKHISR